MSVENIVYADFHKKELLTSPVERAKYLGRHWSRLRMNHASQRQANCAPLSTEKFMQAVNNLITLGFSERLSSDPEGILMRCAERLNECFPDLSPEQRELAQLAAEHYVAIQDPPRAAQEIPETWDQLDNVIPFPVSSGR